MNLSYLFKMRFIVLFTYFTFLLQKKTILCNIFLLHSTKKTPPSKESQDRACRRTWRFSLKSFRTAFLHMRHYRSLSFSLGNLISEFFVNLTYYRKKRNQIQSYILIFYGTVMNAKTKAFWV